MRKLKVCFLRIWEDKLGSGLIINLTWVILVSLYVFIKSLLLDLNYIDVVQNILNSLQLEVHIPIYILLLTCLLFISIVVSVYRQKNYVKSILIKKSKTKELELFMYNSHSEFFDMKICNAFPGQKGLRWFHKKEATYRLGLLLREPLTFRSNKNGIISPFWWFRGLSCNAIENFRKCKNGVWLLNRKEIKPSMIASYRSKSYYKSFIYLETEGLKSVGVNNISNDEIKEMIDSRGYAYETYAIMQGNRKISMEHRDDGATMVGNKVVEIEESTTRMRHLSKYNLFIAPNDSPINYAEDELRIEHYLNRLLNTDSQSEKEGLLNEFITRLEKSKKQF